MFDFHAATRCADLIYCFYINFRLLSVMVYNFYSPATYQGKGQPTYQSRNNNFFHSEPPGYYKCYLCILVNSWHFLIYVVSFVDEVKNILFCYHCTKSSGVYVNCFKKFAYVCMYRKHHHAC